MNKTLKPDILTKYNSEYEYLVRKTRFSLGASSK